MNDGHRRTQQTLERGAKSRDPRNERAPAPACAPCHVAATGPDRVVRGPTDRPRPAGERALTPGPAPGYISVPLWSVPSLLGRMRSLAAWADPNSFSVQVLPGARWCLVFRGQRQRPNTNPHPGWWSWSRAYQRISSDNRGGKTRTEDLPPTSALGLPRAQLPG